MQNQKSSNAKTNNPVQELDLTGVECPLNYVKIKVRLAKLEVGERIMAIIEGEESLKSVSTSLDMDGQKIVSMDPIGNEKHALIVEKRQ
ncbi:sulfurtransferase TusA family protein [Fibrobacterota bacterium]